MNVLVDENKIYEMIKKAVAEVFDEKIEKLKLEKIPYADDNEMEEINSIFGNPEKYNKQDFEKNNI